MDGRMGGWVDGWRGSAEVDGQRGVDGWAVRGEWTGGQVAGWLAPGRTVLVRPGLSRSWTVVAQRQPTSRVCSLRAGRSGGSVSLRHLHSGPRCSLIPTRAGGQARGRATWLGSLAGWPAAGLGHAGAGVGWGKGVGGGRSFPRPRSSFSK